MAQNETEKDTNTTEQSATISVDEMKRSLKCGRLKIYALMEAGILPAVRTHPRGRWIVSRLAFHRWLERAGEDEARVRATQKVA